MAEIVKNWEKKLSNLFCSTCEIKSVRHFQSKKNQVSLINFTLNGKLRKIIVKNFIWGEIKREENILRLCRKKGLPVPEIVGKNKRTLFYEYIDGKNLKPLIKKYKYIKKLLEWIAAFHKSFYWNHKTLLKGDIRFQNFILKNNKIYGLDFEESKIGLPEEDISDFIVSLLEEDKNNLQIMPKLLNIYFEKSGIKLNGLKKYILKNISQRIIWMPEEKEKYLGMIKSVRRKF